MGDPDAVVDRHGRGPRTVHRSEPVVEFVFGNTDDWEVVFHVYVCLEEGDQDHVLFAVAAGLEDCESYGAGGYGEYGGGSGVLVGESGILRRLPVNCGGPKMNRCVGQTAASHAC